MTNVIVYKRKGKNLEKGIEYRNIKRNDKNKIKSESTKVQKLGSALCYAICSIMIVFVNKSVLTVYHFPSAQIVGIIFNFRF